VHAQRVPLHPNDSRRSAHPRLGVGEAKVQTPGADMRRGNDGECVLLMMSPEEAASAVAVIVPSPLAGEGGSMLPRARMGEGYLLKEKPLTRSSSWADHCALSRKGRGHERRAPRILAKCVPLGSSPRGAPRDSKSASTRVCDALCVAGTPLRGPITTVFGYGSRLSARFAGVGRDDDL
jgi:hypothetical protein